MRLSVVTDVMEVVAVLFLIAALAVFVASWSLPAGLASAGAGLLAGSWLLSRGRLGR